MEQISDYLECNVAGVKESRSAVLPMQNNGIGKFFEYANSILPETGRCGWESKKETVVAVFFLSLPIRSS